MKLLSASKKAAKFTFNSLFAISLTFYSLNSLNYLHASSKQYFNQPTEIQNIVQQGQYLDSIQDEFHSDKNTFVYNAFNDNKPIVIFKGGELDNNFFESINDIGYNNEELEKIFKHYDIEYDNSFLNFLGFNIFKDHQNINLEYVEKNNQRITDPERSPYLSLPLKFIYYNNANYFKHFIQKKELFEDTKFNEDEIKEIISIEVGLHELSHQFNGKLRGSKGEDETDYSSIGETHSDILAMIGTYQYMLNNGYTKDDFDIVLETIKKERLEGGIHHNGYMQLTAFSELLKDDPSFIRNFLFTEENIQLLHDYTKNLYFKDMKDILKENPEILKEYIDTTYERTSAAINIRSTSTLENIKEDLNKRIKLLGLKLSVISEYPEDVKKKTIVKALRDMENDDFPEFPEVFLELESRIKNEDKIDIDFLKEVSNELIEKEIEKREHIITFLDHLLMYQYNEKNNNMNLNQIVDELKKLKQKTAKFNDFFGNLMPDFDFVINEIKKNKTLQNLDLKELIYESFINGIFNDDIQYKKNNTPFNYGDSVMKLVINNNLKNQDNNETRNKIIQALGIEDLNTKLKEDVENNSRNQVTNKLAKESKTDFRRRNF